MKRLFCFFLPFLFGINLISAQSQDLDLIKKYLIDSGFNNEDIENLTIESKSFSKSMQASTLYVIQQYNGIPIHNAVGSIAIKSGKIVSFKGSFIHNIASKVNIISPVLSAEDALRSSVTHLKIAPIESLQMISEKTSNKTTFLKTNISEEEIPAKLVYQVVDEKLILSWDLSVLTKDAEHWYSVRINATNGELLSQDDWILHCSFDSHNSKSTSSLLMTPSPLEQKSSSNALAMSPTYNVLPLPGIESPNHGNRELISGQEDPIASPFGWHDTDGIEGAEFTTTEGNNVLASEDLAGLDSPGNRANGGENLVFDFPYDQNASIGEYQNASITNLFYTNNVAHDIWYHYGFDEASGNFQVNNYGKGGDGNDQVFAYAQDGTRFNNASFGTPPDGASPRMQMHLYNPMQPRVKLAINNSSILGEFGVTEGFFIFGTPEIPTLPDNITADLILAIDNISDPDPNDACSDLVNSSNMNGKIAVVRRGECSFFSKIERCQESGAIAIIIVNNVDGDFDIRGVDPIEIPAVGINQVDGEAIISQIENQPSVNATLAKTDPLNWIVGADSSFDNSIVVHEYGHGISNRLTGGPRSASCLDNDEQMGEGWSDWFGIVMTIKPGDKGSDARGRATFANGQPIDGPGNRPNPYSTDMSINPVTYADVSDDTNYSRPHGIGSIWASILWDMTWTFIDRDGYDSDLYNGTGGNNLAMQLVMDGLKLQACSPGFVDGRDGILAAADLLPNSEANKCLIWQVFARRGVGYSADQGSSQSRFDQVEAFDLPPTSQINCTTLNVNEFNSNLFRITPNPSNGIFDIKLSKEIGNSSISIFDINGRQVFNEDTLLKDIYRVTTNLKSGIYLLRIEAKDGSTTSVSKIIIQ
ncbi:T9SS-dependent M36 family metallopeptidase [Aquimarina litoralis]|uniref:T9SS-dependent M36 family metallopeptidase n=1 Tax=Aquimarina litoralis TaxID=584605 RepID=A0ABP3TVV0_9FLAO